jgi:broad specificity phosphatase PhoE
MGLLTLVRHGQASFFADDYDRLSPAGEQQAHLLGRYWASLGIEFDAVVYGPAERHRATGEAVAAEYRAAGLAWPEPRRMPEFDEFAWLGVFEYLVPALADRDARVREIAAAYRQVAGTPEGVTHFEELFRQVMPHYLAGTLEHEQVESWAAFRDRVRRGHEQIRAGGARRIAVFTSAGTMSAAAADVLELSPVSTVKLTMVIRNAAWSEFKFGPDRFLLSTFNCAPHLDGTPGLLTFR